MDIILFLAVLAFLASAIWSAIQRAWALALLALGLTLLTINAAGLITA